MVSPSTTRLTVAATPVGAGWSRCVASRAASTAATSRTTIRTARRGSIPATVADAAAGSSGWRRGVTPARAFLRDRDLVGEVDVLDRVQQPDALVHRPLEGLAARDQPGAAGALVDHG